MPLFQFVELRSNQGGDQTEFSVTAPVSSRSEICRQGESRSHASYAVPPASQGGRKTTARLIGRSRIAGENYGDHSLAIGWVKCIERSNLSVYPARLRGCGRAQHDQEIRPRERLVQSLPNIGRCREFIAIPKDWREACWDRSQFASSSDQAAWHPIILQMSMELLGCSAILLAIANKRPVSRGCLRFVWLVHVLDLAIESPG
jgi:hypothetical protein